MSPAPRVSVCIPARNHARFLSGAIASALSQDVEHLEVIVADDASTDGTAEVVRSFDDARVRYLRHEMPVGAAASRNACTDAARGEYIAWLDADDERLAGTLARQMAVLDRQPEVALIHAGHLVFADSGRELPTWPAPFDSDTVEASGVAFRQLIAANEMATSTVVVRRSVQREAGPFLPEIGASSTDWDMWLRLALRGAVAYLAAPAARYRQHEDSISRATSASGERLRCDARVVRHVLRECRHMIGSPSEAAATAHAALAAKALLHAGDAYISGAAAQARDAIALTGRLAPETPVAELLAAVDRRDTAGFRALSRATLRRLARRLSGTRFGARIARAIAPDDAWDAVLARAGAMVARETPPEAVIAAVAKWDPALLDHAGRRGWNFPDRELHPGGYPTDSDAAIAHLEAMRRVRGVTHLVVPAVSAWWLDHYPEFARSLGAPSWSDADCSIFELEGAR